MNHKINQLKIWFGLPRVRQLLFVTPVSTYTRTRAYLRTRVSYTRVASRIICVVITGLFLTPILFTGVAHANTQGYNTQDSTITKGMAVAVANTQVTSSDDAANSVVYVEKSSIGNASKTLGVVVNPVNDTVAVSANGDQIYVANSGDASVYVSDLNGEVKKGDLLAPSPINGVLMKASTSSQGILGIAQSDFPSSGTQSVSIDGNGGPDHAKVALLQINMDVRFSTNNPNNGKPLLQKSGESLVHHDVSNIQIIVASIILVLLLVVSGGIIYAAISSSIISLGRNPLAKGTILRGLGEVSGLLIAVLGIGFAAVYMVLWI